MITARLLAPISMLALVAGCGSSDPAPSDEGQDTTGASGSAGGAATSTGSSGGSTAAGITGTGGSGTGGGGAGTGGAMSGSGGMAGGATGAGGSNTGAANRPCGKLFYSGEPGEITLASGSTWSDPRGTAGTSTITEITDNPHSGTTALKIALDWNDGQYGGDYGWSFANYNPAKVIDASSATALSIWMRADHVTGGFNVWLNDINKVSSKFYGVPGGTIGLDWKELRVPMSAFAKDGFDPSKLDTFASDMHDDGHGEVTWYLDDGVFVTACQ
jgi:hypothetical protein